MKRSFLFLAAILITVLAFAGCGSSEPGDVIVDEPAGVIEEEDEGISDGEIYQKYLGDWNGLLKFKDCTGDYAQLEGVLTGACARIVIDENGELFPFIGFNLEDIYITSAYYEIDYESEMVVLNGTYNNGSYDEVEATIKDGTLSMEFPFSYENGEFNILVNLRKIGDENWTDEDPGFTQGDLDYVRGMTFEDLAQMMGYTENHYPPAEMLLNGGSSGNAATVELGEKEGADGMVGDYATLKKGLEWCKTERDYDSTYDEIAQQFGAHGKFVDEYEAFDKPFRRYRWFFDDENYVTITFEVKPDGTETWNVTAWDGIKD